MERYTMFLDWKNQYCENDYTTQTELEESDSLTSDYTIKLQKSRQYGTGTKTET